MTNATTETVFAYTVERCGSGRYQCNVMSRETSGGFLLLEPKHWPNKLETSKHPTESMANRHGQDVCARYAAIEKRKNAPPCKADCGYAFAHSTGFHEA